jgi:Ni,Fe-hydrogenase maturation factor
MKVYVFGNSDVKEDNAAFEISERFGKRFPEIDFITVKPNEDIPFIGEDPVILMDVVEGISKPELITEDKIDDLIFRTGTTVHDYDLGFQLKYLKKLGKIGRVYIIGIPKGTNLDRVRPTKGSTLYDSIQSIFKKLVAQDIQGS